MEGSELEPQTNSGNQMVLTTLQGHCSSKHWFTSTPGLKASHQPQDSWKRLTNGVYKQWPNISCKHYLIQNEKKKRGKNKQSRQPSVRTGHFKNKRSKLWKDFWYIQNWHALLKFPAEFQHRRIRRDWEQFQNLRASMKWMQCLPPSDWQLYILREKFFLESNARGL